MEIKIECGCGTKYKFDVQPQNGRMPVPVKCPSCSADGTAQANDIIVKNMTSAILDGAPLPSMAPAEAAVAAAAPAVAAAPSAPTIPAAPRFTPPPPPSMPAPPTPPVAAPRVGLAVAAPPPVAEAESYSDAGAGLLDRTTFFVKERVGLLKLADTYDILDPRTGQVIGIAKEEPPAWAKWLRLVAADYKRNMPTAVNIYEQEGAPPVLSIRRGFTIFRSKIRVVSGDGQSLGYFQSKLISLGGAFGVYDNQDQQVAEVKGNWKGWDFKFVNKNGREIGTVTKKWAGFGKELFTTADNYIISLTDLNGASPAAAALLLAAGLAIDVVYKEN